MCSSDLFVMILWLFILIFLAGSVYRFILQKYFFKTKYWQRYELFAAMYRDLQKAKKKNDVALLHSLFTQFFIVVSHERAGFIRDYMIVDFLEKKEFSHEQIQKWKIFYNKLVQISFSGKSHENNDQLFIEADYWLKQLKEKL